MILRRKLLLFSIQFFGVVSFLTAQDNYRSVHWGIEEGLSVEEQNVMLKDVNGFLWVGSIHGLNRFDGSGFKQYFPDKNKPGTIDGGSSNSLVEDSLHNIWIGTEKGLSRYDIKADTFRNFLPAANAVNTGIIPFWATRDEVYCLETASTITAYNIHSFKQRIQATLSPEKVSNYHGRNAHSVFDAKSNSVWLLEGFRDQPGGGLLEVSLTNEKKTHYKWSCYKHIPDHSHNSTDMCYDRKRNAIWISSMDGLVEFTLDDKQFHHAETRSDIDISKDFIYPEGINADAEGRVWWCSFPAGPIIYDPATRSSTPAFSNGRKQRQIGYTNLYVYCDRDGMVWTSCSEQARGIYQIIPASIPIVRYSADTTQPHSLSGNFLNTIINADHGKLWIGQGDELNIFDPQTGFFQLVSSEKDLPVFQGRLISPVQIDSIHQKALFDIFNQKTNGASELYQMDIPTKQCRHVIFKDSADKNISLDNHDFVYPYKNGAVLFCDKGMFTVDIDSGIAHWTGPALENLGGPFGTDNDHLIFLRRLVVANNLTLSWLNGKWTRIASPVDSLEWGAIYYNKTDKTYWVGCFGQLIHYDKDFGVIHSYTQEDGLIANITTGILPDDNGNIWITFPRNIVKLNIKTGKITSLSEKDGLIKQPFSGPVKTGGDLYFWGNQGIDRITPDKLTESYPPSFVYLKSLEINQKSFPFTTGINDLQELYLRYNENQITIETGIIDYYTKGNSNIRYKLEEINGEWQIAPDNYTIRYDGLPPGNYRLVMQASNAANDFNGPEKILFIHINPPFWQTWWFRTLIVLAAIGTIYGIYRYRLQQVLRLQNIRNRIAADLHDDIGSTLNSISIYSEVAKKDPARQTHALNMIGESSRKVIDAMSDIVWTINPDNDSFEKIVLRMRSLCYNLFRAKKIDFIFRADESLNSLKLSLEERRNFYLIFKEAINNLIKYSGADRVSITLENNSNSVTLIIRDNGAGFDSAQKYNGNGLINMKKRADEMKAQLMIESGKGEGTSIQLNLKS